MRTNIVRASFLILITAASILFSLPSFFQSSSPFFQAIGASPVPLGLDLKGGASVLLEVDMESANKGFLSRTAHSLRQALRAEKICVKNIQITSESISFSAEGDQALSIVKKSAGQDFMVKKEGSVITVTPSAAALSSQQSMLVEQSMDILGRRIDESGTKEANILRQGFNRILVQMPGVSDTRELLTLLGKTAQLNFHLMAKSEFGSLRAPSLEGARTYFLQHLPEINGDMLVDAQPSFDDSGQPAVSFRLNAVGARKFAAVTKKNIGSPFAIVLDGKVVSAPVIQSTIAGGSGIITGQFSTQEARQLAILLRSGALPADIKVLEESCVGPDLGADSIKLGQSATILSIAFLFVFMWVIYGLHFGTVANIGLALNITLLIAGMSLLETTLTLPGIAGIALTLGMAVDANVLIFERIKEELHSGQPFLTAIHTGFKRALITIVDSNVTTLMGAFFLYQFGNGPVRGFAVSLSLGILVSMFTAITISRNIIMLTAKEKNV